MTDDFDEYVTVTDLPGIVGLSDVHIWRLRRAHQFPEPVIFGTVTKRWRLSQVQAWMRARSRDARRARSRAST